MIIQACLNGSRTADFHPRLPASIGAIVGDAVAAIEAGAAELHVHPRDAEGCESLLAVDETVGALRAACPGTLIGVSTGAWIEGDIERTRAAIAGWEMLPDYASVNLSEPDAPAIMGLLARKGIGIEAGIATRDDAVRLLELSRHDGILRILIELDHGGQLEEEIATSDAILALLRRAGTARPILLHGFNATVWPFVRRARQHRFSTRVGLEDGRALPDGSIAANNAEIVAAAVEIYRQPA